jgi:midasin
MSCSCLHASCLHAQVRIHLDDQIDAKSLMGAYVCTAVPGEFAWQPGPLTQAVTEGRWVLIEDINMAPPDVLAALVPLLESGTLTVPSRGEVLHAAPGFQLVATVTSAPSAGGTGGASAAAGGGAYATSNMAKELLGNLWAYVRVEPPAEHEQLAMLGGCYPLTAPLLPAAVATLSLIHLAGSQGASGAWGGSGHTSSAGHHTSQEGRQSGGAGKKTQPKAAYVMDGASLRLAAPQAWWHAAAAAAAAGAGLRPGELALALARHFSVRDLFKWAARMQVGMGCY